VCGSRRTLCAAAAILVLLGAGAPTSPAHGDEVAIDEGVDSIDPPRRGRITIGYQVQHTRGQITDVGTLAGPNTTTDTHALKLALDYRLTPRWELHFSLPYLRKRTDSKPLGANGLPQGAHTLDLLPPGREYVEFIDDGRYHGNWQDVTLGASYYTQWRGFQVEPRINLVFPSNNYPFYGNAATGERTKRLRMGIEVSRRIGLSEAWYSVGYDFELRENLLDLGHNKHYLSGSLGYDFAHGVSARLWGVLRKGQGQGFNDPPPGQPEGTPVRTCRCEFWYQHDRHGRHDYGTAGLGVGWSFAPEWNVSLSAGRMYWGNTVHKLRYVYGLQLARGF
jgi:hypothetical protein